MAPANLQNIFPGDSEMARRMRELDWSKAGLGVPQNWPDNLRIAVSLCLTSRIPIVIYWGREFTVLYNDPYISFLGENKHPRFLGQPGRECWSEIWDTIGPMLEGVRATGEATWSEDLLMFFARRLPLEEVYVRFTFGPVLASDGVTVDGIFCPCTETTEQVVSARRLDILSKLGVRPSEAQTIQAACEQAARVLGENPQDIPFAAVYLLDDAGAEASLAARVNLPDRSNWLPPRISLSERTPWPFSRVIEGRRPEELSNFDHIGQFSGVLWPELVTTALVLPLLAAGHEKLSGLMIAGVSPRRMLDDAYREFFDLVAGHVATAITHAHADEEERKRVAALAEIDRAKTAFFSNVSHEFRTPLTLILGPVEEMLSGAFGETTELQHAHLETLRRNAVRLQKLVNTLLDYARVEAGRIEASYEPVDLARLTRELASTFCSAIHRAGLLFVVNCPLIDEPIYIDRDLWEKIVLNLLSNALKFTFQGAIEVSLTPEDDSVAFAVKDTGVGIAETELPHLFDRFHRVRGARARTQEGSGIGLALVHELVRLHGGTLHVESTLGSGTSFTVSIPKGSAHLPSERLSSKRNLSSTALGAAPFVEEALRWLPDDGQIKASSLPIGAPAVTLSRSAAPASSERILVVDDNMDMRNYLQRLLELHWTVETAEGGSKALAIARAQPPDLIISDVMIPKLDGFELLRELRAHHQTKTIPVILLSARAGEEGYVEGMNAGADDYVVKPFGARELLARVRARLEISRVRREVEQRMKDLDQRKDEFLANMSHEIRSPLTGIMGYADILLTRLTNPEDIECLKTIKESGDYLIEIVNDILDLSKIEAGKIVLNIEAVSVHAALAEIQVLMDVRARQKKLLLALRYDDGLPENIRTDRTRLRQIVINLVSNAIKFTERGRVEIIARWLRNAEAIQIEVVDTGIGIAQQQQARLFQPFTQADGTSAREYGGTGLGLSITKRLVEMLGGSISFDSEPQKGSTFRVTIPSGGPPNPWGNTATAAARTLATPLLLDHHVLVVEDRDEIRRLISHFIREAGGRATAVSNGEAAIEAIASEKPSDPVQVVIMDIQMPHVDGYEVTRRLRAKGFRNPIIALTAGAMAGDREQCLRAGCDDYLSKPINRQVLLQLIAYHAERASRVPIEQKLLKVLLVDDSQAGCNLMTRLLGKWGHQIRTAQDGRSALPLAQEFRPDVVILDFKLPDMTGYELLQKLKTMDAIRTATFIATSGYDPTDVEGSVAFDYFLQKPVDMAKLEAILRSESSCSRPIS